MGEVVALAAALLTANGAWFAWALRQGEPAFWIDSAMEPARWRAHHRRLYVRWFPLSAAFLFPVQLAAMLHLVLGLFALAIFGALVFWPLDKLSGLRCAVRKHLHEVERGDDHRATQEGR